MRKLVFVMLVLVCATSCRKDLTNLEAAPEGANTVETNSSKCAAGYHWHYPTGRTPGYCCDTKHWWMF